MLDNPTQFNNPFSFEVTFECLQELDDDLEWKVVYVANANDQTQDLVLDEILVGPVPVGINKFVLQADPPSPEAIKEDLLGVTVVLVTCSYKEREFVRVGYYVNNEYQYTDDERKRFIEEWKTKQQQKKEKARLLEAGKKEKENKTEVGSEKNEKKSSGTDTKEEKNKGDNASTDSDNNNNNNNDDKKISPEKDGVDKGAETDDIKKEPTGDGNKKRKPSESEPGSDETIPAAANDKPSDGNETKTEEKDDAPLTKEDESNKDGEKSEINSKKGDEQEDGSKGTKEDNDNDDDNNNKKEAEGGKEDQPPASKKARVEGGDSGKPTGWTWLEDDTNGEGVDDDDDDDDDDEDDDENDKGDIVVEPTTSTANSGEEPPPMPSPPHPIDLSRALRQILADKPRVTKFPISWGTSDGNKKDEETQVQDGFRGESTVVSTE